MVDKKCVYHYSLLTEIEYEIKDVDPATATSSIEVLSRLNNYKKYGMNIEIYTKICK